MFPVALYTTGHTGKYTAIHSIKSTCPGTSFQYNSIKVHFIEITIILFVLCYHLENC